MKTLIELIKLENYFQPIKFLIEMQLSVFYSVPSLKNARLNSNKKIFKNIYNVLKFAKKIFIIIIYQNFINTEITEGP